MRSSDYMNEFKFPGDFDDTFETKTTTAKERVNNLVLNALMTSSREDRKIMYLDGPQGYTTSVLAKHFKPDQLHAVNANPLFKNHPVLKKTLTFQCLVYEMIRDAAPYSKGRKMITLSYDLLLDYCCTFEGNDVCRPKKDLELAFHKQLLAKKNGILWLTFCLRSPSGRKFPNTIGNIKEFLITEGSNYGYNFKILNEGQYGVGNSMYFIILKTM